MRQTIIAVIIAVLAVVFALQNSQDAILTLYFWDVKFSLALLIIITLIIGIAVGMLLRMKRIMNDKRTISELKKKIVFLEAPKNTSSSNPSSKQV
ncbi:MAG: lipopolysaccharide assembly protein LapA domain-containing protein [Bacteroidia bacterium]